MKEADQSEFAHSVTEHTKYLAQVKFLGAASGMTIEQIETIIATTQAEVSALIQDVFITEVLRLNAAAQETKQ